MTIPSNAIPVTISSLPVAVTPGPADVIPIVHNGITSKITVGALVGASGAVPETRQVLAGGALSGGGALTGDITISLNPIGTATTVGSSSAIPVFSYDTYGRVTQSTTAPVLTPTLQQVVDSGASCTTRVTLNTLTLTSQPVSSFDVVRLVDLQSSSLINFRPAVNYLATTPIGSPAAIYTNGAGVGSATITDTVKLVVDGVEIVAPSGTTRILLVAQGVMNTPVSGTTVAAFVANGVYTVTAATATSYTLTRASDIPLYGNYYFVTDGVFHDSSSWVNSTSGTITVGTTPISYTQFFASPNAGNLAPLALGSGSSGVSTNYSREDHVHPITITTGTAVAGGSLAYLAATGTLTYRPAFNTTLALSASTEMVKGLDNVFSLTKTGDAAYTLGIISDPAPATGSFLRSDGTWTIPSGTGLGTITFAAPAAFTTKVTTTTGTAALTLGFTVTDTMAEPPTTAMQIPVANIAFGLDSILPGSRAGLVPSVVEVTSPAYATSLVYQKLSPRAITGTQTTGFVPIISYSGEPEAAVLSYGTLTPGSVAGTASAGSIPVINVSTADPPVTTLAYGKLAPSSITGTQTDGFVPKITVSGTPAVTTLSYGPLGPGSFTGTPTAGQVPTIFVDSTTTPPTVTLKYASVSDPNALVYAIALG